MLRPLDISLSGLNAASLRMNVSANNTANVLSDGFKASRVVNQAQAEGGVSSTVQKVDTPGVKAPRSTEKSGFVELSNVDLATEIIDQTIAHRTYQANLQTLRTADEMIGTIIDVIV